jgi:hypothetical protein
VLKPEFTNLIPYALDLYRPHQPLDDVVAKFVRLFSRAWGVHFLGIWDTVKAFGMIWPKSLPHLRFNPSVKIVRHALALEERRTMYAPTTWGGTDGDQRGTPAGFIVPAMPPRSIGDQNVKEVWFEGCHSDVGGGLPGEKGSLYKHSLEWMVREAIDNGLLVDEKALQDVRSERAGLARKVESLKGAWNLAEITPRLHLQNQFPPAWRRRPTLGLWRGRALADAHRSGGLTVHASVPESLLTDLKIKNPELKILPARERTSSRPASSSTTSQ